MLHCKSIRILTFVAICGVLTGCTGEPASLDEALEKGSTALEKKDYAKASKMATRALSFRDNNVNALMIRALSAEATGDRALALDSARQAAKSDPSSFAAFYTLGRIHSNNDKSLPEAQNALLRALELKAGDIDALTLLATLYLRTRSGASAISCLDTLQKNNPELSNSVKFLNSYAVGCFYAGRTAAGMEKLSAAWKLDKNDPDTALNIAVYHERYREPANLKAAVSAYKKFIVLAHNNPKYTARVAEVEKHIDAISNK